MNNTKKEKRQQKDNKKINHDLAEAQNIHRFLKVRRRFLTVAGQNQNIWCGKNNF